MNSIPQQPAFDKPKTGPRRLVTARQAAAYLGISQATFYELLPRLRARGLRAVTMPSPRGSRPLRRFDTRSLDRLIDRATQREEALC